MGVNFEFGELPIFWENIFLASWASKCWKCLPKPLFTHALLPHVAGDSWGILPHVFVVFLHFPHGWEFNLGNDQWMGSSLGVFVMDFLIVVAGKFHFFFVQ